MKCQYCDEVCLGIDDVETMHTECRQELTAFLQSVIASLVIANDSLIAAKAEIEELRDEIDALKMGIAEERLSKVRFH